MVVRCSILLKVLVHLALAILGLTGGGSGAWAISVQQDRGECVACHQGKVPRPGEEDGPGAWEDSVHAQVGIGCIDCHREQGRVGLPEPLLEPHEGRPGKAHDLIIARAPDLRGRLSARCSSCHEESAETVQHSVHGDWAKEHRSAAAPLCIDCHAAHRIPAREESASRSDKAQWLRHPADGAIGLCVGCHAQRGQSYLSSLHGRLHVTGVKGTPVCLDCHSGHAPPRSDPASTIHPDRVGQLCADCHAGDRPALEQVAMGDHLAHAGSAAGAAAHRQDEIPGWGDPVRWIVVGYGVFGTLLLIYLVTLNLLSTYRCMKKHRGKFGTKNHLWWLLLPLLCLPDPVQAHDGAWIDLDTPCIDCHLHRREQGELLRKRMADSLGSAHRAIAGGISCSSCHGEDQSHPAPAALGREACLNCHQEEHIASVAGMGFHGETRHRGESFGCADCHPAHEPGRSQNKFVHEERAFQHCLVCHPAMGD